MLVAVPSLRRTTALRGLAAASLAAAALAGCGAAPGSDVTSDPAAAELVDTRWRGVSSGPDVQLELGFTLQADGTIAFEQWGAESVRYDDPTDTWVVEGGTLRVHLSNIDDIDFLDYAGPAMPDRTIRLDGVDGRGSDEYSMTISRQ